MLRKGPRIAHSKGIRKKGFSANWRNNGVEALLFNLVAKASGRMLHELFLRRFLAKKM